MRVNQAFAWHCDECDTGFATSFMGGMMMTRCPNCGDPIPDGPDAQMAIAEQNNTGLFECFDCGHVFGYSGGAGNNRHNKPDCTECGSDNTAQV